jgi:putative peptide zinc metalloprotease protein
MRRTTRLALAVLLLLLGLTAVATPAGASGDTTAVAINTRDGSSIFRLAFGIRRTMQEVVDETNAAVAVASCDSCQTVAVAVQVVLIMSDPDVVTPTNLALALNEECTSCDTLASAYQYVTTTGGVVRFDAEGNRELAEIRVAFRDLSRQTDLSIEEIQAQVDPLVERLYAVVNDHLVSVGPPEDTIATPSPGEAVSRSPAPSTPDEQTSPADDGSPAPTGDDSPTSEPSPDAATSPSPEANTTETP